MFICVNITKKKVSRVLLLFTPEWQVCIHAYMRRYGVIGWPLRVGAIWFYLPRTYFVTSTKQYICSVVVIVCFYFICHYVWSVMDMLLLFVSSYVLMDLYLTNLSSYTRMDFDWIQTKKNLSNDLCNFMVNILSRRQWLMSRSGEFTQGLEVNMCICIWSCICSSKWNSNTAAIHVLTNIIHDYSHRSNNKNMCGYKNKRTAAKVKLHFHQ